MKTSVILKKLSVLLSVAGIALSLSACAGGGSSGETQQAAPSAAVTPAESQSVQSAGSSGMLPGAGKTTTPSGLQFEEVVVGTGPSPQPGQLVTVHYTGWLVNGNKFDSSVDRGQPFQFTLGKGEVIKGWDEGVATMKVGGKRKLTIPSALGYGPSGMPPTIPPDSTLLFDVELLGAQ
ncbi:MAG: FKBP-type peptidyl-prolyl cis-trans isomerase [Candidatus Obscuribacterales bacterium]|nr:FKBP-type peptidyl-prolyl cis-trans isomerase [Candidatus Obscuribacterales bacterium]